MNNKTFSLTALKRDNFKKSARESRQEGLVPGIVYGHNFESLSIKTDYSELLKLYRQTGESALIDLTVEKKSIKVLIHKLVLNPVTRKIDHVDFYVVNLKEKTSIPVPFEFIGESNAVKTLGGLLIKDCESILLRCLPTEIPSHIDVNIAKLQNLGDHLTVSDLDINLDKYEIMDLSSDTIVVTVLSPKLSVENTEEEKTEENSEEAKDEKKSE